MHFQYESHGSPDNASAQGLAPELLGYVDAGKLISNRHNYPELMIQLSPENERRLRVIQAVLLEIPLNHGSHEQVTSLTPARLLPKDRGTHTYALDRSLGLDRYVFFHWGVPEWSVYGREITLFSAQILLDPATVVTPYDIGTGGLADQGPYESLEQTVQQQVNAYFDTMITGYDWLDLTSRRILIDYTKAKKKHREVHGSLDNFHYFYLINLPTSWGEIKHLGPVGGELIAGRTGKTQWEEYYRHIYARGLAYQNVEYAANTPHAIDPSPARCGIDIEQAGQFWPQLLG